MMRQEITAAVVLLLWFSPAGAHGSASIDEDTCVRWIDSSRVHFNAYQPDLDPMSHFCDEIPALGTTLVVIDLVDRALRNIPAALRISVLDDRAVGATLLNLPARVYPTGVIETSVEFSTAGRYLAEVTTGGDFEQSARFLIQVGEKGFEIGSFVRNVVFILLLIWIGRRLYRRWRPASKTTAG